MRNLLWLCLLLPLTLAHSEQSSKVNVTDRDTAVPAQLPLQQPLPLGAGNHSVLPTAEKLIRYRRHPAKRGKQRRRRVKNPANKIKYGPPSYPASPPISYYKPASSHSSYPSHLEEPSFSIEDFQHLKFDGGDFHIPASSYEAQSMDLNLYSQEDNDLYGAHKFPSLEYNYPSHESPPETSYEHTPHQKYGVPPPVHQSFEPTSYETPESHGPSHPAPPSTHYGVPSAPAHVPSYTHPGPPPAPDSYSIYEQKIPNAGYHQSFAEPPRAPQPPPVHGSNYEIAYSPPAYEISTSYQDNEPDYEQSYPASVGSAHDGHFAEPPPPPPAPPQHPPQYHPPQHAPPAHPPAYSPPAPPSYSPPAPPSYSPPAPPPYSPPAPPPYSPPAPPSYSPPHPPPHPPQHPSTSYDQPEAQPPSSYTNVELHPHPNPPPAQQHYPNENYVLPSEELPLNQNHKFPSFDFPKSSYEVPIYDPIPFEASNKEEQESYPPILPDSSSNDLPTDAHASGSSQSPTARRKRKRRPSTISKKHTLDVPELQEAYDAYDASHVHVRGTDLDTAAHGSRSRYVTSTTTTTTTTLSTPAPWSPMRVRTTSSGGFIPTIITSTPPPSPTTSRIRGRGTSRFRSRPTTEAASSTAVTIEKSRSQSYYDGTLAPPTYQHSSRQTRPTTRPGQGRGGELELEPHWLCSPAPRGIPH
ncbi:hypothetical protein ACLKA6_015763 [Drosophila palustris]